MRGVRGSAGNIIGDFNETAPLDVDFVGANQFRDDLMIDRSHEHRFSRVAEDHCSDPCGEVRDRDDAPGVVMNNRNFYRGHLAAFRLHGFSFCYEVGAVSTFARRYAVQLS